MADHKGTPMNPALAGVASVAVRTALSLGAYEWYMRRQRSLHAVVTNVHGPDRRMALSGAVVTDMMPLAIGGGGNVAVTFAALSYAGTITITVIAAEDTGPMAADIAGALDTELRELIASR